LRRIDDARRLYREAWEAAQDSYEAAMAAHYVAHLESDPNEALKWHRTALEQAARDSRGEELMGSLMVSLGGAYEAVGQFEEAERWYELAAEKGVQHSPES
jgi:tetratricopeptide (TPR) repeat protein